MILHGDCLDRLRDMADNSVDSLVTDPPAGISFMGKSWDGDRGGRDQWIAWMRDVMTETLRVLKPGAHGLVWALPRTSHWTAMALEDAGFEIRDCVYHLFGTGFPKSLDVSKAIDKATGAERTESTWIDAYHDGGNREISPAKGYEPGTDSSTMGNGNLRTLPATDAAKQWQGWGTALKPSVECWWLVRKPCSEKTVAANVLKWGTGALNIDASRIGTDEQLSGSGKMMLQYGGQNSRPFQEDPNHGGYTPNTQGRFPSHLLLDEEAAAALDDQTGELGVSRGGNSKAQQKDIYGKFSAPKDGKDPGFGDSGGASRFFYVAKASKKDKGEGNTHPTVKNTALMEYLIRMVTPPGGTVLDCFTGSGSTGVAAKRLGLSFVGIEQDADFVAIAEARLDAVG